MQSLSETQLGKIQVELYKEIKKNGSVRSLRAALTRFAALCHHIRQVPVFLFGIAGITIVLFLFSGFPKFHHSYVRYASIYLFIASASSVTISTISSSTHYLHILLGIPGGWKIGTSILTAIPNATLPSLHMPSHLNLLTLSTELTFLRPCFATSSLDTQSLHVI